MQVEEFLRELVFDYNNEGIQKVFQKLRRILSNIPDQDLDPSSFHRLLEPFGLKSQVCTLPERTAIKPLHCIT